MGGLSHYLESAGIATAGISLVREHTEAMHPPRALWVPFDLGRPLGPPDAPEFQRDVLRALLATLERPSGPVLDDFPLDAPPGGDDAEGWACPIALPEPEPVTDLDHALLAIRTEIALLRPWWEQSLRTRGRTAIAVSGLEGGQAELMAEVLTRYAYGEDPAPPDGARHELPVLLRFLADDLRAFYAEATAAQPGGGHPGAHEFARWLLGQTRLGDVLLRVRDRLVASEDRALRGLAGVLFPRAFDLRGDEPRPPR